MLVTEPTTLDAKADTDTALYCLAVRARQSHPLPADTRVLVVEPCLAFVHSSFPPQRRRTIASAPESHLTVASHGAQPPGGRGHAARCDTRLGTSYAGRPHACAPRAPPGTSLSRARPVFESLAYDPDPGVRAVPCWVGSGQASG